MLKRCFLNGLDSFGPSLVEWNKRLFSKHIVEFERNGGWKNKFCVNPGRAEEIKKQQSKIGCFICVLLFGGILLLKQHKII